jgi:hypothetical protein
MDGRLLGWRPTEAVRMCPSLGHRLAPTALLRGVLPLRACCSPEIGGRTTEERAAGLESLHMRREKLIAWICARARGSIPVDVSLLLLVLLLPFPFSSSSHRQRRGRPDQPIKTLRGTTCRSPPTLSISHSAAAVTLPALYLCRSPSSIHCFAASSWMNQTSNTRLPLPDRA